MPTPRAHDRSIDRVRANPRYIRRAARTPFRTELPEHPSTDIGSDTPDPSGPDPEHQHHHTDHPTRNYEHNRRERSVRIQRRSREHDPDQRGAPDTPEGQHPTQQPPSPRACRGAQRHNLPLRQPTRSSAHTHPCIEEHHRVDLTFPHPFHDHIVLHTPIRGPQILVPRAPALAAHRAPVLLDARPLDRVETRRAVPHHEPTRDLSAILERSPPLVRANLAPRTPRSPSNNDPDRNHPEQRAGPAQQAEHTRQPIQRGPDPSRESPPEPPHPNNHPERHEPAPDDQHPPEHTPFERFTSWRFGLIESIGLARSLVPTELQIPVPPALNNLPPIVEHRAAPPDERAHKPRDHARSPVRQSPITQRTSSGSFAVRIDSFNALLCPSRIVFPSHEIFCRMTCIAWRSPRVSIIRSK